MEALLRGGSQERERRAGTPNVAGAVGMALALQEAASERAEAAVRVARQRDRLRSGILEAADGLVVETVDWAGLGATPAPHLLHLSCRGVHREALLLQLDRDGVAASAGSSCASGAPERSHVVAALGVPEGYAEGALRLSLGWGTTDAEIDHAITVIPRAVRQLVGTATAAERR
jgi:cysteine desulfurase